MKVTVIGAGLAGCEAANYLANNGASVELWEMKPKKYSPAHSLSDFAELVCSNSLKSDELSSSSGLLKAELRRFDSLILSCADMTKVPAGGALAVDRELFAKAVTERIVNNKNIHIVYNEAETVPSEGYVIIATGPLTSEAMSESISGYLGSAGLHFFDAASPIVTAESIDESCSFRLARYGKGGDDYINCPLTYDEYEAFYGELIAAETVERKDFERDTKVFEGCMPVETAAKRGRDTLRFGIMKPVGLTDPQTGKRPYAVLQLRQDNYSATLYNLVGFQTNLKFGEQKRVFSMIPALKNAEFVRYGVMHRNTYLDSPKFLDCFFSLRGEPRISFAGQMTGVEGYIESAASGLVAAIGCLARMRNETPQPLPAESGLGALSAYVCTPSANFQPMNMNFGILPPLADRIRAKKERNTALATRSLEAIDRYIETNIRR